MRTATAKYPDRCIEMKRPLDLLIVDDDDICMLLQRRVARASGLFNSIRSAANGKLALDILNQAKNGKDPLPDVIFLDLNMPVMNGFQFLDAFNNLNLKNKAKISIVILSSSPDEKDKADAAALGAAFYLTKPLSLGQTAMAVSAISATGSMPCYTHYSRPAADIGMLPKQ